MKHLFFFIPLLLFLVHNKVNAEVLYAKNFNYIKESNAYQLIIKRNKDEKLQYTISKNPQKTTFILNYVSETAFLDALGDTSDILAIINPQYVYNQQIRDLLKKETILSIISANNTPPVEMILKLNPAYYSLDVFSQKSLPLKILSSNHIKTITPIYFLEETPLAKAEWIKFYGILTGDLEKAQTVFRQIEKDYLAGKNGLAKHLKEKVSVILGLPYQGVWYTASHSSLEVKFIEDAGGVYLTREFEKNKRLESLALSQEDLIKALSKTDVWIIKSNEHLTKEILLKRYPYLKQIPSFKHIRIYNSSKRLKEQANDIFEEADLHVEKVLNDMILIIHPSLGKNSDLTYYEEVL